MRVMVMVLSLFAGLIMVDQAALPLRLATLAGGAVGFDLAAVTLGLYCCWALAAALVYAVPGGAVWLFAIAGVIGLFGGLALAYPVLVVWGGVATVLAGLTSLARREKQADDLRARQRAWQDQATVLTLEQVHATCQLTAADATPVSIVHLEHVTPTASHGS